MIELLLNCNIVDLPRFESALSEHAASVNNNKSPPSKAFVVTTVVNIRGWQVLS
jgi:hypothetical protein